jgi:hypothetical protein
MQMQLPKVMVPFSCHWIFSLLGEEMVVVSFDIVYEKWGWLLIFWNFAGVPFLYCASSVYLSKLYVMHSLNLSLFISPSIAHPTWYYVICFALLFGGYYIFDTANAQKNSFRMRLKDPNWKPRYLLLLSVHYSFPAAHFRSCLGLIYRRPPNISKLKSVCIVFALDIFGT